MPRLSVTTGHENKLNPLGALKTLVPYLLSSILYLSGVFALFCPLPLLFIKLRGRVRPLYFFLIVLANLALVVVASGVVNGLIYALAFLSFSLLVPVFVHRKWSLEKIAVVTLFAGIILGCLALYGYGFATKISILKEFRSETVQALDQVLENMSPETRQNWIGDRDADTWKKDFLVEVPSALVIFYLVTIWANLMIITRLNPGGMRQKLGLDALFFKHWKAPEWLVWPTLLCGFLLVFDFGKTSILAQGVFKVFLAVYAIQGISILSFVFDVWKIQGVFRSLAFMLVVFLMLPFLLAVGFFDLWFDFRSKLRQS